jgi:hypothetical protein
LNRGEEAVEAMSTEVVVHEKRLEAALDYLRPRDTQLRARGCRHRLGHVGRCRLERRSTGGRGKEGMTATLVSGDAWGVGERVRVGSARAAGFFAGKKSDLDLNIFSANQPSRQRGSGIEKGNEACETKAAAAAWAKQGGDGVLRERRWGSKAASAEGKTEVSE